MQEIAIFLHPFAHFPPLPTCTPVRKDRFPLRTSGTSVP